MKVVIAPDSFKESLPANQVAEAIKRGFKRVIPDAEYLLLSVGDGGEGTVDAIKSSLDLEEKTVQVAGPFGDEVQIPYYEKKELALFEVADLIGLEKIPNEKRYPLEIQTKGIGQLILHLIDQGKKDIYIGVGGTASNDGGIGIASGIGYQFYDENGNELQACGQSLSAIRKILKEGVLEIPSDVHIKILADVANPLCGPQGATFTFGKQKGLDPSKFQEVDAAIKDFYSKVGPEILKLDGAGAGGGIAAGLCVFAGAEIVSGIQTCLDLINFDDKVADANLVIVGEGRLDSQSMAGKAPIGVAKRTPKGVPVIAICGSLDEDLPPLPFENIIAVFSILEKSEPLEDSLKNAATYLEHTATSLAQILSLKKN
ncbi:glycerate kinase [Streptococcus sp. Marseille-Q0941]|uniref:glycerate kinase n=1 Tax=Streptococcus sp. Marseille-Q0941 TaxID=2942206 RepID=UPI002072AE28|nr:glycerate kinase [Streptococcus sp. Marseille-Q0941]